MLIWIFFSKTARKHILGSSSVKSSEVSVKYLESPSCNPNITEQKPSSLCVSYLLSHNPKLLQLTPEQHSRTQPSPQPCPEAKPFSAAAGENTAFTSTVCSTLPEPQLLHTLTVTTWPQTLPVAAVS